jgi:hypothetical protein
MARDDDYETPWTRQLLVGLGALVAVALVIGGVVSVVALGAAKVTGLDDAAPTATQPPSLYLPSGEPTTTPEAFPDPAGSHEPSPTEPPTQAPKPRKKRAKSISLQAFPHKVSANQRINLTGVYAGGEGARLQVQRFEGRWTDFPVNASVSGGQFNTYIFTGRSGLNRFRVVDPGSGRKSNAVRVSVG